jgi:hypothetical protein
MPFLQEFYIIPVGGNLIYAKSKYNEMDQVLFSAFLTGLNAFSSEAFSEEILSFNLQKSKYVIINVNSLLFVARTNLKAKNEEICQILSKMEHIFFAHFPPETFKDGFGGCIDKFEILNKLYDQFFAGSAEKALNAIW